MIALANSFAERFSTPSTCIWLVRFPEEHCALHSRVFLFQMFNFRLPFFHGLQRLCKTCTALPMCKYANYARLTLQNQCSYGKKLDFRNQLDILPPSGLSFRCPALQPRRVGFFVDIPSSTKQSQSPSKSGLGETDDDIAFRNERAEICAISVSLCYQVADQL